jgi:hypothetical protein
MMKSGINKFTESIYAGPISVFKETYEFVKNSNDFSGDPIPGFMGTYFLVAELKG